MLRSLVVALLCLSLIAPLAASAAVLPPNNAHATPQFGRRRIPNSPAVQEAERERVRNLNKERQLKLKQDTDKLLQLATELKEYVDKTNENILSIDVIKKTEEIEKLAKSVREKMKRAYEVPGNDDQIFPR